MTGNEEWMTEAVCRKRHIDLWFPPLDAEVPEHYYAISREVCRQCPVWSKCLDLGTNEKWGMWGGLTPQERTALTDSPKVSALKPHGSWVRYRQGCRCNECVDAHNQNYKIDLSIIPKMGEPVGDLEMLRYALLPPSR